MRHPTIIVTFIFNIDKLTDKFSIFVFKIRSIEIAQLYITFLQIFHTKFNHQQLMRGNTTKNKSKTYERL